MNSLSGKKIFKNYPGKERTSWLKKNLIILIVSLSISLWGFSQDIPKRMVNADSTSSTRIMPEKNYLMESKGVNKPRFWLVSGVHTVAYAGTLVILNEAWYKNYPRRGFTSFDDSKEWLQMDKIGHGWSAYNLSRGSAKAWKWAGFSDRQSDIIGSSSGFAFLTVIEFLDARSTRWGWSWSDIAANTVGTGLYLSQQLAWNEQRIQFKFSFHRKNYDDDQLNDRTDQLFGKSWYERMLKDYNGQTYWFSANLKSFFKESKLPAWFNIAIGYGANGMYGGFENLGRDGIGNITFDRRNIPRVRQFYISPDIDLTKIKSNKRWVRTVLLMLNTFKIPAPALMINSKGKFRVHPFYF